MIYFPMSFYIVSVNQSTSEMNDALLEEVQFFQLQLPISLLYFCFVYQTGCSLAAPSYRTIFMSSFFLGLVFFDFILQCMESFAVV